MERDLMDQVCSPGEFSPDLVFGLRFQTEKRGDRRLESLGSFDGVQFDASRTIWSGLRIEDHDCYKRSSLFREADGFSRVDADSELRCEVLQYFICMLTTHITRN